MKNINNLLILLTAAVTISACNSGGGGGSSDIQSASGDATINKTSTINYSYTATGCKSIQVGGNCSVSLTYQTSGTGTVFNGPLYIRTYGADSTTQTYGFNSTISSCPSASATQQSCNFTITATESASTETQAVTLIAGSNSIFNYFTSFQIGQ